MPGISVRSLGGRQRVGALHSIAHESSLGGDNKVNVNVRKSIATAKCGNPVAAKATERSCGYILDEILKTRHMEYFGKPTSPSRGRLTVRSSTFIVRTATLEGPHNTHRWLYPLHSGLVSTPASPLDSNTSPSASSG